MGKDKFCIREMKRWMVIALVLVAGVFASCSKENKLAVYLFYCDISEFTSDGDVKDPELREACSALRLDLTTELSKLRFNDKWDIWVVNDKFSVEDAKAEAEYDKNLPVVKELESKYKKRVEEMGLQSESSFYIKVVYNLSRSVPADHSSAYLREYSFYLKYN